MSPDPLEQFAAWFEEARDALRMPEAMAVASATRHGAPSARMVLLKQFDDRGFVFFTSYLSRKAKELDENPNAALLFHWDPLGRQVRVEGTAKRISPEESETYIRTRPAGSRVSALASRQSEVVGTREDLEEAVAELSGRYAGSELPIPGDWGGYRVQPESFEFWQNRDDRLHDRLRYLPAAAGWKLERLAP